MIKLEGNLEKISFVEKIIKIPLWQSYDLLIYLPFFLALSIIGFSAIIDGFFDTHLMKPNLGMIGVILGIACIVPLYLLLHRIIKYPGIIFTKDYVIIPPVKIYHWRKRIIHYNKIKKIVFGGSKYDYKVLCDDNKCINFPKHNSTNKLWYDFDHELSKRYSKAIKEKEKCPG